MWKVGLVLKIFTEVFENINRRKWVYGHEKLMNWAHDGYDFDEILNIK